MANIHLTIAYTRNSHSEQRIDLWRQNKIGSEWNLNFRSILSLTFQLSFSFHACLKNYETNRNSAFVVVGCWLFCCFRQQQVQERQACCCSCALCLVLKIFDRRFWSFFFFFFLCFLFKISCRFGERGYLVYSWLFSDFFLTVFRWIVTYQ